MQAEIEKQNQDQQLKQAQAEEAIEQERLKAQQVLEEERSKYLLEIEQTKIKTDALLKQMKEEQER